MSTTLTSPIGFVSLRTAALVAVLVFPTAARGATAEVGQPLPGTDLIADQVAVDTATGNPELVTFIDDRPISDGREPVARALSFLSRYSSAFGLAHPTRQLRPIGVVRDLLGRDHAAFEQIVSGVPVFGVRVLVHFDEDGAVAAVNGSVIPELDIDPVPTMAASEAEASALRIIAKQTGRFRGDLELVGTELMVYREGLLRGVPGTNHLAWQVEVTAGHDLHEVLYLDAHSGQLVDQRSEVHNIHRVVHLNTMPNPIWSEGDPLPYTGSSATANAEITELVRATGDTHDLFANLSNGQYLSFNGTDATMNAIYDAVNIDCPNAVESGGVTAFCTGMVSDDVAAHEWTHAYTGWTHALVYQWQSGALNEATSDIFGELVDQTNGRGSDLPNSPRPVATCSAAGGSPTPTLEVIAPAAMAGPYTAGGAAFNPLAPWSVSGLVELADDGSGIPSDACQALAPLSPGTIALIDRGSCLFRDKVVRAQTAGAAGVIVVNNQGNDVFEMGGDPPRLAIPAVLVGASDGNLIRSALGDGVIASIALDGDTADSLRWLIGEDTAALGVLRDMWSPTCFGDPDRVSSAYYQCSSSDNGGVHTNNGIPNRAFALIVDGGTVNGHIVEGIGVTKTARIYWRAMTVYQTPVTDFRHHADLLELSCTDLVGAPLYDLGTGALSPESISLNDCLQVSAAMEAVEMRLAPVQCQYGTLLDPDPPAVTGGLVLFLESFDVEPGSGWERSNHGVFPEYDQRDWEWTDDTPPGGDGGAFFAIDSVLVGDCVPGSDDQSGVMELTSPEIVIPTGVWAPVLRFDHWIATERDYDGGNLKVSVNGGSFALVPRSAFTFNAYNGLLTVSGNTNPLAGEPAFTGTDDGSMSGTWGQSQVDLSGLVSAGDRVRVRFDLGVDGCNGAEGWYIDNVAVIAAGGDVRQSGRRVRP